MKLDEAIDHALNGNGVLFAGTGFSIGARNIEGVLLPSTDAFAKRLAELASIQTLNPDLHQVARAFVRKLGTTALAELIKSTFSVAAVSDVQKAVTAIKWQRIYTTNYDNVLEVAARDLKRPLASVTAASRAEEHAQKPNLCVHINGFAPTLTDDKLDHELKLTNTSYLTDAFADSAWAHLLRSDLRAARVVFFLGYSLHHDLDVARILFSDPSSKARCVFVVAEDIDELQRSTLDDFGEVCSIGVDQFVNRLISRKASFVPAQEEPIFACVESVALPAASGAPKDIEVIDLLLQGDCRDSFVWRSLNTSGPSDYFLRRSKLSEVVDTLSNHGQDVVIHSDFANGKTLFVRAAALEMVSRGVRVFVLTNPGRTLTRELQTIARLTEATLLIVENYTRFGECDNAEMQTLLRRSVHRVVEGGRMDLVGKC